VVFTNHIWALGVIGQKKWSWKVRFSDFQSESPCTRIHITIWS